MNWLTRLLAPPLALACVMAFFMAAQSPTTQRKVTPQQRSPDSVSDHHKTASKPERTVSQQPKGLLSDWRPD
ncbi:MAG: hypothetical protein ABIR53_07855, partial [Paraperlucidibaca sp.]